MFKNYFKVAIRNILKYKFFSAINILGMTIGITACMLIVLYVSDELSYDKFHSKAEQMYRVNLNARLGGQDVNTATTCPIMSSTLVADIPEIEEATRFASPFNSDQAPVKYGDLAFIQDKVFAVDSNFFEFFSYKLLEGDVKTALKEPNTVVLTRDVAKKYFGNEPAIGKLITLGGDNETFKVTGIAENAPTNSHITFQVLVSASSFDYLKRTEWLNNNLYTYFTLNKNASIDAVQKKFVAMAEKYVGPELEKLMGVDLKQLHTSGSAFGYGSIKVTDIHLRSTTRDEAEAGGNLMYVYLLAGVGIFIIIIACINFMNLATARSAGRAKEVGLRKTLGSLRGQLIGQFLAESVWYSIITVILAAGACYLLLPYFNLLAGKQLTMDVFTSPVFLAAILILILFVGLASGSYPAFYLTAFNPVEVLKGKVRSGMKSKGVRSFLVVFQFAISICLIIFTAVVYQQITFMQERNMGIDKHNVLIVQGAWKLDKNMMAFKNSVGQVSGVEKVSYTNNSFPGVNNTTVFRAAADEQDHIMGVYYADYDHQGVLKFELKDGRYFSADFPSDSSAILLNESAVKEFGFKNPLEEEILHTDNEGTTRLKVVGVFKDFNFETLKTSVRPLAIRLTDRASHLMIRYNGKSAETVSAIENLWKQQTANEPFNYAFLDENFDRLFRSEQRMGQLFSVFSGLAIFIACLGLFALAAFTAEQRTKEIGIRKALGASMPNLILLLSKEFTRLVLFAFVPAAAFGWFVSEKWLSGFAYRIDVDPMIIIFSGLATITIAWLTVSYQSIKAASMNPVNSLRYE
ncbi:MAG TPA: ABC transporter permease [Ohtaekwangia sp.]